MDIFESLVGVKYYCAKLKATFTVTQFQKDGFHKGVFKMERTSIPIIVFRHTNAPVVPNQFDFCFAGADVKPNEFIGGVGLGAIISILPDALIIGGAFPTHMGVTTFHGDFVRG
jgi:hypothetical protein